MRTSFIGIFLISVSILTFVSSEIPMNLRSPSASSLTVSPTSPPNILPISSSLHQPSSAKSIKFSNNRHEPSIKWHDIQRRQFKNFAKRFLKRFQVDLSPVDRPNHLSPSSPFSTSSLRFQATEANHKPVDSLSPKLLSIDLSVLDRPLTLPMVYFGDFEDLSFPRGSRSNEIEENYYMTHQQHDNSANDRNLDEESTDYNNYYSDNANDEMPNEIPLDPVYSDEGGEGLRVNDQHEPHFNRFDYQTFNSYQFPDHLSTGNDALSDYLHDVKLSTIKQFNLNRQQNRFPYPTKSMDHRWRKVLYPNRINHFSGHESTAPREQLATWLNQSPSDVLEDDRIHANYPHHGVLPLNKNLIGSSKLSTQNHIHHHQHHHPTTFKSHSTGNKEEEAANNHQST